MKAVFKKRLSYHQIGKLCRGYCSSFNPNRTIFLILKRLIHWKKEINAFKGILKRYDKVKSKAKHNFTAEDISRALNEVIEDNDDREEARQHSAESFRNFLTSSFHIQAEIVIHHF